MSEEDTQFAGFATRLFGELDLMFQDLASERAHEDYETAFKTEQKIKDYMACRAYDFACHVVTQNTLIAHGDMNKISDMPTWPEDAK